MKGKIKVEVENCIRLFTKQKGCIILELNVCIDHVHLISMIPLKFSVSTMAGILKGRTAIRIFNRFRNLRKQTYWGNHFWAPGYCVDTIGLNEEMIRKYVKYQEKKEKEEEKKRN